MILKIFSCVFDIVWVLLPKNRIEQSVFIWSLVHSPISQWAPLRPEGALPTDATVMESCILILHRGMFTSRNLCLKNKMNFSKFVGFDAFCQKSNKKIDGRKINKKPAEQSMRFPQLPLLFLWGTALAHRLSHPINLESNPSSGT